MLDATVIVNAIVASFQSIPQLAAELGAPAILPTVSITGHYSFAGEENSLARKLSQMPAPSMVVAYNRIISGNFSGATMFRHFVEVFYRARNSAMNGTGLSPNTVLNMAMNYPISVPQVANNIRYIDLCNGNLWWRDVVGPRMVDELGQDFWQLLITFDEWGDAGPDGVDYLCLGPTKGATTHGSAHTE